MDIMRILSRSKDLANRFPQNSTRFFKNSAGGDIFHDSAGGDIFHDSSIPRRPGRGGRGPTNKVALHHSRVALRTFRGTDLPINKNSLNKNETLRFTFFVVTYAISGVFWRIEMENAQNGERNRNLAPLKIPKYVS